MRSKKFRTWKATLDLWICGRCFMKHGQIYEADDWIEPEPPLHVRCRCVIEALKARLAGTATKNGKDGADWWLKNSGKLPDYYVTQAEAKACGYRPILGNLAQILPGKMLTKGIYKNRNGHLPSAPGRIWYEADINYKGGFRGMARIVYSNDGLIFVTYNHYFTFEEIV